MGREIRRVPPGWEHPKYDAVRYNHIRGLHYANVFHPMHDRSYTEACREWEDDHEKWKRGEHEYQVSLREEPMEGFEPSEFYWDDCGMPPDKSYYFPEWVPEERTAYQVYENVSEGTPVSPVFLTVIELEDWLVNQGMSRDAAVSFIERGWTFSGLASSRGLAWGMNEVAEVLAKTPAAGGDGDA